MTEAEVQWVYDNLKELLGLGRTATNRRLAEELGVTEQNLYNHKQRGRLPLRQLTSVCSEKGVSINVALGRKAPATAADRPPSPERGRPLDPEETLLLDAWQSLSGSNRERVRELVNLLLDAQAEDLRRKRLGGATDADAKGGQSGGGASNSRP